MCTPTDMDSLLFPIFMAIVGKKLGLILKIILSRESYQSSFDCKPLSPSCRKIFKIHPLDNFVDYLSDVIV